MNTTQTNQLRDLLDTLSLGELAPPEAHCINELLSQDPEARALYLDTMAVEAELHAVHAFQGAGSQVERSRPRGGGLLRSRPAGFWMTLACSVVGAALLSSLLTASYVSSEAMPVADASDEGALPTLGSIVATRNCRWGSQQRACGDPVRCGQQLELRHGVAEIEFQTGATVLLEGPARLEVEQDGGLLLRRGRLAVQSAEELASLPIRAGRIRIIEQNASYGLIAEASGREEVHVFQGSVLAVLTGASGQRVQTCRLTGGNGGRLDGESDELTPIPAYSDLFVRSLSPGAGPRDGLYAIETFDYADGPLGEKNGGFGWAGPWADIETAESPDGESTNSVELRPLTWPGLPPVGNRAVQYGQNNRIRRVLSTSIKGVFDEAGYIENRDAQRLVGREGKTIYLAFLQRVSQTGDVFYGLELNRGDGNRNRVLCIGNGVEQSGYAVTSDVHGLLNDKAVSLGAENTDVNLFVVRIDFGEDDKDTATVYRNPASLLEEQACEASAVLHGNFAFDRISLGNFNGSKVHEVDAIRLGGDFRVVTGQRSFMQSQLAFTAPRGDDQRRLFDGLASYSVAQPRRAGRTWELGR
ncbi:MAG: hypothetical protein KDA37_05610 [Planctomycetales bacterium]|nr:hypothetical protein [Planctomycetales bacterium]